jgi:hypothetical protein
MMLGLVQCGLRWEKPTARPQGPSEGPNRETRGGCWYYYGLDSRSASRHRIAPAVRNLYLGFSVARVPSENR